MQAAVCLGPFCVNMWSVWADLLWKGALLMLTNVLSGFHILCTICVLTSGLWILTNMKVISLYNVITGAPTLLFLLFVFLFSKKKILFLSWSSLCQPYICHLHIYATASTIFQKFVFGTTTVQFIARNSLELLLTWTASWTVQLTQNAQAHLPVNRALDKQSIWFCYKFGWFEKWQVVVVTFDAAARGGLWVDSGEPASSSLHGLTAPPVVSYLERPARDLPCGIHTPQQRFHELPLALSLNRDPGQLGTWTRRCLEK